MFQTNRAVGILDSVISWGTLIYIYAYIYTSLWPRRLSIWHSWEGECGRDAEELGTGWQSGCGCGSQDGQAKLWTEEVQSFSCELNMLQQQAK